MSFEEVKDVIDREVEKVIFIQSKNGKSSDVIRGMVKGLVLGMVKAFEKSGVISQMDGLNIYLEVYDGWYAYNGV